MKQTFKGNVITKGKDNKYSLVEAQIYFKEITWHVKARMKNGGFATNLYLKDGHTLLMDIPHDVFAKEYNEAMGFNEENTADFRSTDETTFLKPETETPETPQEAGPGNNNDVPTNPGE